MKRQYLILVALLGCLILSFVYAWQRYPRQRRAEKQSVRNVAGTVSPVRAAVFEGSNQALAIPEPAPLPFQVKRDLFRPMDGKPAGAAAKTGKSLQVKPPPLPPPPPPTPVELARQQLQLYKIMGFVRRGGRQTAFVAKGDTVLLVREGDSLIRGYTVSRIADYRLVMRNENGDELLLAGR